VGGIGVRRTPQSRYVVLRTSMPGRGEGKDKKATYLPFNDTGLSRRFLNHNSSQITGACEIV
jgi:hypothetical protein